MAHLNEIVIDAWHPAALARGPCGLSWRASGGLDARPVAVDTPSDCLTMTRRGSRWG
ncbi:hypothetical protein SAMN02745244_00448 [Tessaracoccus bendigoensis DSM 12906]|uniref:Uncharacterized protein n=1 Tax=Tessaracoccus bendigoensis DSM 12906 TaxID=1123357 RepID=A0A1M6BIR4_9ACTN|nr:hypothetical protein SAMN02745244_00448 [Tessaracoccus bendigoensis DSM 12906]